MLLLSSGVVQVEGLLGAAPCFVLELLAALGDGGVGTGGNTLGQREISLFKFG